MKIPLTQDEFAEIDETDLDLVNRHSWHCHISKSGYKYAVTNIGFNESRRLLAMHNLIMGFKHVDHKDGNTLNNKRSNLRKATIAQNNHNCKKYKTNKSGYKGVSWDKKGSVWRAQIGLNGNRIYIGSFNDAIAAAKAYDEAAKRLHGEFAHLNFAD